ncbi:hypothetical protein [Demequina aurantiaca]|uniref:DUF7927 domain-containing protein n=1 Tax=Demequina aurantiaca TaxID=676200 RepID=UPI003D3394A0
MASSVMLPAAAASAAPESEVTTRWADGTPASSTVGQVVIAEVRINVNDDAAAPSNDDVDNFTANFTTVQGIFTELPDACLVTGVTPASSIAADGLSMVCNFGTQEQGTALALQVPIQVVGGPGNTSGELSFGASVGSVTAPELTHEVTAPFMMDFTLAGSSSITSRVDNARLLQFEWTLNLGKGSIVGPNSVTYLLNVNPTVGTVSNVSACGAFTDQVASGHPNSGAGSATERTAPTATTCTITRVGSTNNFNLTLTGIDYSLAQVPTKNSGGGSLPVDRSAVASGKFIVNIQSAAGGSVTVSANTPTYTSADGTATSVDDASNNASSKAFTNPGLWISSWNRPFSGSGGTSFDDTFRVSPGTLVRSSTYFTSAVADQNLTDTQNVGLCSILDNKYVDYENVLLVTLPDMSVADEGVFQWYVGGTQAAINPASPSYNPGAINNCGALTGGSWVSVEPTDKTTVQAVRMLMAFGDIKNNTITHMFVQQTIQDDTPVGMDVWQFSNNFIGGTGWAPTDINFGIITPTPNARYTHTNGYRDILRVVGVTPSIAKAASSTVLALGQSAEFTLTYSANGAAAPATIDGYEIVDTMPAGLTYVAGSASPEPTVTVSGGHQVLTWSLDGVPTNEENTLTYEAVANENATPGQRLTNVVKSSVQGRTSAEASASTTVANSGRTIIGKSADQALIPNVDGNGNGEGSWTVTLRSEDPTAQAFTDVIDILPYNGDGRGTDFDGTYSVTDVISTGTVYYTTAAPATISDDPADAANGAAGNPAGNTIGWTTTAPADASTITAVRVIGGTFLPAQTRSFQIVIETAGASGGDVFVNRSQGRAEHTELVMRTSAPTTVSEFFAYDLKKYVLGADGEWHDAQDTNDADWPQLSPGATAQYKFVVTNTGQGDLADIVVADPLLGVNWEIDSLDAGDSVESATYDYAITDETESPLRNEACATAPLPASSSQAELAESCDEANIEIGAYTVSKTSDPVSGSEVETGDVVTYTVEVKHEGDADILASFEDDLAAVLDDATYNNDVSASAGTAAVSGDLLTWTGALVKDDVVTVTYSVTVTNDGDRTMTNVVAPTAPNGTCVPADDENADCTTTHTVLEDGSYTVSKTSDPSSGAVLEVGDIVTYTVEVKHEGEADVEASFRDNLFSVLEHSTWNDDVDASAGTATFTGYRLNWEGTLSEGDVVTVTYSVTVTSDGDITNVVTPVAPNGTCVPADDENADCTTNHIILEEGSYTISKTSDPASGSAVETGDVVTYTVEVKHEGEADVLASFEDNLAAVLDDADYNDDVTASAGTASVTGDVLTWDGNLSDGDIVTVTYSVTVTNDGDRTMTNVVAPATPDGTCVPADDENADCTTTHIVLEDGSYTVSKTSDPASGSAVEIGDVLTYTVEVNHFGEADVLASFEDDLTGVFTHAAYNDDVTASAGTAVVSGDELTWAGNLSQDDVVTVTYSVTVLSAGEITNVVAPTSPNGVCVPADDENADCTTTHTALEDGSYTVSKTSDPATASIVEIGDVITYTVEVNHFGEADVAASFEDTMTQVLDDATYNDDVTASAGTASVSGDVLTWAGNLSQGDTVTVTYSVTVTAAGDRTLTNVVAPTTTDGVCVPAPDEDADCTTTHRVLDDGSFTVSKTSDPVSGSTVEIGDVITYTVEVNHVGEADVAASFEDTLTGVFGHAEYNDDVSASAGAAALTGDVLTWAGSLTEGDTVDVTYSVTVRSAGEITNVVAPTSPNGICVPADDENADCTTTHYALELGSYTVSKTSDPISGTEVEIGDVVTYTVEVSHVGEAAVLASFEDTLTEVFDDATFNDDVSASAGEATLTGDSLSWSGVMVKGDVVTVTYSVTVTAAGDRVLLNVVAPTSTDGVCVPAPDQNENCTTTHDAPENEPSGFALSTLSHTGASLTLGGVAMLLLMLGGAFLVVRRRYDLA